MRYRILKSICASLNYRRLQIPWGCCVSQLGSAAAPGAHQPQRRLSPEGGGRGTAWALTRARGRIGGGSCVVWTPSVTLVACQRQWEPSCLTLLIPLRLDVALSVEVVLQPINMWWNHPSKVTSGGGWLLGYGDTALGLGGGRGNCAITCL